MKINFDDKADALYIQFQNGKVKRTIKLEDRILIDIGKDNKIFGIEILDAKERISLKAISKLDYRVPMKSVVMR